MWYIWLILAGVFLIIEIMTVGFLIFWLSIGSLFAMITSLFTDNIVIQTTVFVISSTILIFVTKPFVKKFGQVQNPISTNFYSIIGKIGIVTTEINSANSTGQIKIDGEIWSATCEDSSSVIPMGTKVKVLEIKGVKAIVTPIQIVSNV